MSGKPIDEAVDLRALDGAANYLAGRYSEHDSWVQAIRAATRTLTAPQQQACGCRNCEVCDGREAIAAQQQGQAVDRERTLTAARFRAACYALKEAVEGATGEVWRSESGSRLKDRPEWVSFYNLVSDMRERGGPDPYAQPTQQEQQAQGGGEVVAWMTPGGDVSRSFYWCLERCLPGQEPQPLYTAPPSAPVASEHVRRLVGHLAQWVLCMSHNESYFGEAAGHLKSTVEELVRSVDPIYPPKPSPSDSLAGVEIHTATVPFMPAQLPTTTAPPSAPVGVSSEDRIVLMRLKDALPDVGLNGWIDGVRVIERILAQQPAAVDVARSGSSIMDGAVSFVEALSAQHQEPKS